jgi:hypothetical protein
MYLTCKLLCFGLHFNGKRHENEDNYHLTNRLNCNHYIFNIEAAEYSYDPLILEQFCVEATNCQQENSDRHSCFTVHFCPACIFSPSSSLYLKLICDYWVN